MTQRPAKAFDLRVAERMAVGGAVRGVMLSSAGLLIVCGIARGSKQRDLAMPQLSRPMMETSPIGASHDGGAPLQGLPPLVAPAVQPPARALLVLGPTQSPPIQAPPTQATAAQLQAVQSTPAQPQRAVAQPVQPKPLLQQPAQLPRIQPPIVQPPIAPAPPAPAPIAPPPIAPAPPVQPEPFRPGPFPPGPLPPQPGEGAIEAAPEVFWFTPPAQAPAQTPDELRVLLDDLNSTSSDSRSSARRDLLLMSPQSLGALRSAVAMVRPMSPAQVGFLKEAVIHVYLSGQAYSAIEGSSFLGVSMESIVLHESPARADETGLRLAVSIRERIPGFPAYTVLQDGDIVLAVDDQAITTGQEQFRALVTSVPAGKAVMIRVLRAGKVVEVRAVPYATPVEARVVRAGSPMELPNMLAAREAAGRRYWQDQFAPLLDPPAMRDQPSENAATPGSPTPSPLRSADAAR